MRLLQQLLPHSHPPPHSYSTLSTLGSRLCRSATLKCQTRQQQRRNLSTNLHEWQAKQFLASRYQVPIQRFTTVVKVNETNVALQSLRQQNINKFVIKAQVKSGGRGNGQFQNGFSRGVHVINADDPVKICHIIKNMLGTRLVTAQTGQSGELCEKVMICESFDIDKERYLSFSIDSQSQKLLLMYNSCGGSGVESGDDEAADSTLKKIYFSPGYELTCYDLTEICNDLKFEYKHHHMVRDCISQLFKAFVRNRLSLLEINPFAIAKESDSIMCFDCKIVLDDESKFESQELLDDSTHELNDFGGHIACFANGAGLCMATMDCINKAGSSVSVFHDVGGKSDKAALENAILNSLHSKAIVFNIFGGIVDCYHIVTKLTSILPKDYTNVFVSLRGNNAENAAYHLETRGIKSFDDMNKAIKAAVECDTISKQETPSISSWS